MENIKIKSHLAFNKIENEVVIIDFEADKQFHKLNEVAGFIFLNINDSKDIHSLTEKVCDEFDIDFITAKNDLLETIEDLKRANLIITS